MRRPAAGAQGRIRGAARSSSGCRSPPAKRLGVSRSLLGPYGTSSCDCLCFRKTDIIVKTLVGNGVSRSTMTLSRHLLSEHARLSDPRALTTILDQLALGSKVIGRDLSVAGLINALGITGDTNVQGEAVQKLD